MRWLSIAILGYILLGLQIGLAPYIAIRGVTPNLVLIGIVFISLTSPRQPALLAALVLGWVQDMLSLHPLGLFAICYVIAALFILSARQFVYREHPLTHFSFTLVAGLLTAAILLLHGWIYPLMPAVTTAAGAISPARTSADSLLFGSLYSAVLAMLLLFPLRHSDRWQFAETRRLV